MNIYQLLKVIMLLSIFNTVALLVNFCQKIVTKTLEFKYPSMVYMITIQQVFLNTCTGVFVVSTIYIAIRDFGKTDKPGMMARIMMNFKNLRKTYLLSAFYILNSLFAIYGLQLINIPIYMAARRCQVLFVIVMKLILCECQQISKSMVFSAFIITAATVSAILGDLENGSLMGYMYLIIGNLGGVFYQETSRKLQKTGKIDSTELLQQMSQTSLCFMLVFNYLSGNMQQSIEFLQTIEDSQIYQIMGVLVLLMAVQFSRQFALYACTRNTEVFVITLSTNVKDVVGTIISLLVFDDINLSNQVKISLVASFLGAFGFAILKYYETQKQTAEYYLKNEASQQTMGNELSKTQDIEAKLLKK